MVLEIGLVTVVCVAILYGMYKKPEWFGIASHAVGTAIDAGVAKAEAAVKKPSANT